ncbi:MAG: RodZ domain-containing protein [Desulfuromonadales bacterium]
MSGTIETPTDTPGNSPGTILKRCREYHDISLEEASQTTKIAISYLKSLEEDQISGFANLTYLKGFLRIYAVYLGLNPDDMARMYDKLYSAKFGKITIESTSAKAGRSTRRLVSLRKLVVPTVLLLLILITATLFKRQPAPAIRPSQPAVIPAVALPATAVQPYRTSANVRTAPHETGEPTTESKSAMSNGSDKLQQSKKTADPGKSFILKIKITQNGNLNAAVDGLEPQSYELTVGDIVEWKAEKSVALDVSNAGGIDVELNGKPLKQLGPSGKPAYVVFDADGIKP